MCGISPALGLDSPGVGPVELERGGTLLLVLLGFFSIFVSVQWVVRRPSSGQRAAELSSIQQKNQKRNWTAICAGQATTALIHFWQKRRPHHGDILATKQTEKKQETRYRRLKLWRLLEEDESSPRGGQDPKMRPFPQWDKMCLQKGAVCFIKDPKRDIF